MTLQMEDESTIQKNIADKLIAALKTGGFVLYAQKILQLAASGHGGPPFQEVLVRFREEEEKLLPPGTFFPMLQEYRLLPYVDRWVVSRLASWIQESRARTPGSPVPVNGVNLSEDTLRERTGDFGEIVYAGMDWADPALARRSMELLANEVMPRVNKAIGVPAKEAPREAARI